MKLSMNNNSELTHEQGEQFLADAPTPMEVRSAGLATDQQNTYYRP
jgi:hypothetical protein